MTEEEIAARMKEMEERAASRSAADVDALLAGHAAARDERKRREAERDRVFGSVRR